MSISILSDSLRRLANKIQLQDNWIVNISFGQENVYIQLSEKATPEQIATLEEYFGSDLSLAGLGDYENSGCSYFIKP